MQKLENVISGRSRGRSRPVVDAADLSLRLEQERLAALSRYDFLDGGSEDEFDHIARLAAHLFDAPIATVSLVGRDVQ